VSRCQCETRLPGFGGGELAKVDPIIARVARFICMVGTQRKCSLH
jgi:hypothetical protein